MCGRASRPLIREKTRMNARIQIVGRLPVELSRRVRAAAKRQHLSMNAFMIEALTRAVAAVPQTPRRVLPETMEDA